MKIISLNLHKIIFFFFSAITVWSVYSFFSWHIKPLPDKFPPEVESYLMSNMEEGLPVFLSSELLDRTVLGYPQLNIFPAGGDAWQNAPLFFEFYIVSGFRNLKCGDISDDHSGEKIVRQDGMTLLRCKKQGKGGRVLTASSMIHNFKVSTEGTTTQLPFYMGRFSTGDRNWQRINVEPAFFDGKRKMAVNAHPLGDKKKIFIEIPPLKKSFKHISAGFGVADSGTTRRGAPVKVSFSQNEKVLEFRSVDGKWIKSELKDFSGEHPITVTVSTQNAARRHFYFDIYYFSGD